MSVTLEAYTELMKNTMILCATVIALAGLASAQETNPLMALPGMKTASPTTIASATIPLAPRDLISDVSNAPNPFDTRKGGIEGQTDVSYQLSHDAAVTLSSIRF